MSKKFFFAIILIISFAEHLNADATIAWNKAAPSVVSIAPTWPGYDNPGFGAPPGTAPEGTGIVISKEGHILTASHVISKATKILIRDVVGNESEARVIFDDPKTDLAIIKSKIVIEPIKINQSKYRVIILTIIVLGLLFLIATSGRYILPQILQLIKVGLPFLTKFIGI